MEAGDWPPQSDHPFPSSPFTGVEALAARQPGEEAAKPRTTNALNQAEVGNGPR